MASSVIEDARGLAEDADLFERSLTSLLLTLQAPVITHRDRLATSHRASDLLTRIVDRSDALYGSLQPSNEERNREIDALSGGGAQGGDLAEFYQRLAKIKDYHRKYPTATNVRVGGDREVDFAALEGGDAEWLDKKFTGEEALGRYLDLHELHDEWNNLAPPSSSGQASAGGWKRYTYLQYLAAVTNFSLSPQLKSSPAYAKYLTNLLSYLSNFYERVLPLGDLDTFLKAADDDFARRWDAGEVPGWAQQAEEDEQQKESEGIWCAACAFRLLRSCFDPTHAPPTTQAKSRSRKSRSTRRT